jgi:subtilisin family serine protease
LPVVIGDQETDFWALEVPRGTDPTVIVERYGHNLIGQVGQLENIYLIQKKPDTIHGDTHPHFSLLDTDISWFERQVERKRHKRLPSDPLYPDQWHLHLTASTHVSLNVEPAWNLGYIGTGVVIAVVDDGLQYTHPDIAPNYAPDGSYDFNYNDESPFPDGQSDTHGTSAGGTAGAANNSLCGVGSGFGAKLAGIRILAKGVSDSAEASALSYKLNYNDIYTNSWGPPDDGKRLEGPGRLSLLALEQGVAQGRNGKGSIYVWACGNGKRSGDNCNYDGWANLRYTIAIGSVDFNGYSSWYSEPCAALLAVTPSSGNSLSITTTDCTGSKGYSSGDCTSSFSGTSASAPMAAGAIALMLQANPDLGWRDVQGVIVSTSYKCDPSDADWVQNGVGLWVNHKYGFGLVDASAAVQKALTWQNLPPTIQTKVENVQTIAIPESTSTYLDIPFQVVDNFVVEHVDLFLTATHPRRGDLRILLVSPQGTVSVMSEYHNDVNANIFWRYNTVRSWGEQSAGTWTMKIRDEGAGNVGNFSGNSYVTS